MGYFQRPRCSASLQIRSSLFSLTGDGSTGSLFRCVSGAPPLPEQGPFAAGLLHLSASVAAPVGCTAALRVFAPLALSLCLVSRAFAQSPVDGTLRGRVFSSPQISPFAPRLASRRDDSSWQQTVHAARDGSFTVLDLAPGDYTLQAGPCSPQHLSISPGAITEAEINLSSCASGQPLARNPPRFRSQRWTRPNFPSLIPPHTTQRSRLHRQTRRPVMNPPHRRPPARPANSASPDRASTASRRPQTPRFLTASRPPKTSTPARAAPAEAPHLSYLRRIRHAFLSTPATLFLRAEWQRRRPHRSHLARTGHAPARHRLRAHSTERLRRNQSILCRYALQQRCDHLATPQACRQPRSSWSRRGLSVLTAPLPLAATRIALPLA